MELWNDIEGYECYQVSNYGNVRSTKYKQPRILRPGDVGTGHQQVTLRIDGKNQKILVHRLVAQAFILNPENLPFVDHINGIPADNRAENLRWATNRTNLQNRNDNREGRTASRFVGVSFRRRDNTWIARIFIEAKSRFLGSFKTEEEAALAYDSALTSFGFKCINLKL
ncbi:hypothetical protein GCM10027443_25300 [Pontibacter brevis]